jgi:hypothetical protein
MDGRTDRQMDGRTDLPTYLYIYIFNVIGFTLGGSVNMQYIQSNTHT